MITKNIVSLGLELEGGVTQNHLDAICRKFKRAEHESDGSVNVEWETRAELITDAEIKYWSTSMLRLRQFVRYVFHDRFMFRQNNSCGNHIHVRFKDMKKAVAVFSYEPTRKKFARAYKRFATQRDAKYLYRLNNRFCSPRTSDDDVIDQIETKDGKSHSRYHAINLNSANLYGTIEFRIMPHMRDADELLDAINWLVKTVDKLLNEDLEIESNQRLMEYQIGKANRNLEEIKKTTRVFVKIGGEHYV